MIAESECIRGDNFPGICRIHDRHENASPGCWLLCGRRTQPSRLSIANLIGESLQIFAAVKFVIPSPEYKSGPLSQKRREREREIVPDLSSLAPIFPLDPQNDPPDGGFFDSIRITNLRNRVNESLQLVILVLFVSFIYLFILFSSFSFLFAGNRWQDWNNG